MMTTEQKPQTVEAQQERALSLAHLLLKKKRETQQEMVEEAKNNPRKMALIEELHRSNAERGTPTAQV